VQAYLASSCDGRLTLPRLGNTVLILLGRAAAVGLADETWRSDDDGRFGWRITEQLTTTPQQKAPRPGSEQATLVAMLVHD
jgi:hypothetical protein